jgi:ribonuclease HI
MAWEAAHFDGLVADIFGYNAVQLGVPDPTSCAPTGCLSASGPGPAMCLSKPITPLCLLRPAVSIWWSAPCLEFAVKPHQVLREVERVLVPEGHVLIAGFNPISLFGLKRLVAGKCGAYPWRGQFCRRRLKDWLALLSFETGSQASGCFVPALEQKAWIDRLNCLDRVGALVAARRQGVSHPRHQAGAWHAADHAEMGSQGRRAGVGAAHRESGNAQGHPRKPPTREILDEIDIFTDGACSGNPGPGGWGRSACRPHEKELWGGEPATTNNRMELLAVIRGLQALNRPCRRVVLHRLAIRAEGYFRVDSRLEGAWLEDRRQGSGQERRSVAGAGCRTQSLHQITWRWVKGTPATWKTNGPTPGPTRR